MTHNINLKNTDELISLSGSIKVSKDNKFLENFDTGTSQADILRKSMAMAAFLKEIEKKLTKEEREKIKDIESKKSLGKNVDPFELEYENSQFKKLENILSGEIENVNGKNELTNDVKILSKRLRKTIGFEITRYHAPKQTNK